MPNIRNSKTAVGRVSGRQNLRKWSRSTDMRRLTTGKLSEKCVVGRFRRSANVIQCTYTNLDSTV